MLFGAARHCFMPEFFAVILSLLIARQSLAQQPPKSAPPSRIVEISNYLAQSDNALACDPLTARSLANKALDAASAARETDPALID